MKVEVVLNYFDLFSRQTDLKLQQKKQFNQGVWLQDEQKDR